MTSNPLESTLQNDDNGGNVTPSTPSANSRRSRSQRRAENRAARELALSRSTDNGLSNDDLSANGLPKNTEKLEELLNIYREDNEYLRAVANLLIRKTNELSANYRKNNSLLKKLVVEETDKINSVNKFNQFSEIIEVPVVIHPMGSDITSVYHDECKIVTKELHSFVMNLSDKFYTILPTDPTNLRIHTDFLSSTLIQLRIDINLGTLITLLKNHPHLKFTTFESIHNYVKKFINYEDPIIYQRYLELTLQKINLCSSLHLPEVISEILIDQTTMHIFIGDNNALVEFPVSPISYNKNNISIRDGILDLNIDDDLPIDFSVEIDEKDICYYPNIMNNSTYLSTLQDTISYLSVSLDERGTFKVMNEAISMLDSTKPIIEYLMDPNSGVKFHYDQIPNKGNLLGNIVIDTQNTITPSFTCEFSNLLPLSNRLKKRSGSINLGRIEYPYNVVKLHFPTFMLGDNNTSNVIPIIDKIENNRNIPITSRSFRYSHEGEVDISIYIDVDFSVFEVAPILVMHNLVSQTNENKLLIEPGITNPIWQLLTDARVNGLSNCIQRARIDTNIEIVEGELIFRRYHPSDRKEYPIYEISKEIEKISKSIW